MRETNTSVSGTGCEQLHRALCDCHRRITYAPARETTCRHLNRSLAECLVTLACPDESKAVRVLCSGAGSSLKKSQCQQAQLQLSVCLSSHQDGDEIKAEACSQKILFEPFYDAGLAATSMIIHPYEATRLTFAYKNCNKDRYASGAMTAYGIGRKTGLSDVSMSKTLEPNEDMFVFSLW